jgi:hypothetical protein
MAQKYAVCPFYKHETEVTVSCEGIIGARAVVIKFGDPNKAWSHKENYCKDMDGYQRCAICKALMEKWEGIQG